MNISANGIAFTALQEGFRANAYPDPATGGEPWTCGYGCTGPDIHRGTVMTEEQARERLVARLNDAVCVISANVPSRLTQNQIDALADFIFNVGQGNFLKSTMLRRLRAGDMAMAADEFGKWVYAAGTVMPGLVKRRAAERALFLRLDS